MYAQFEYMLVMYITQEKYSKSSTFSYIYKVFIQAYSEDIYYV